MFMTRHMGLNLDNGQVGLVLDEVTLPYIQLAPVNVKKPSFLQGALRVLSGRERGGAPPPPPPQLLPQMGIRHSVFFRGDKGLTYVCPRLVRKGVVCWRDLVVAGVVHLEHLDVIAYTYKMAYDMGVQDVRLQSMAPDNVDRGLALD